MLQWLAGRSLRAFIKVRQAPCGRVHVLDDTEPEGEPSHASFVPLPAPRRAVLKFNDIGQRIGDSHQNAKLTDTQVDELTALRRMGLSYMDLARRFGISKSSVRDIVICRRRSQTPARLKDIQ